MSTVEEKGVQRAVRNPSVEVLRCMLMFLIVLHHCAYQGKWAGDGTQWGMLFAYTGLTMWHVDAFVSISGWFGIKFTWREFFNIWGQLVFYTLLCAGLSYFIRDVGFSWERLVVSGGWFGGTYLMLMFAAPLLNTAVDELSRRGRSSVLPIWGILAVGMFFAWAPLHLMSGVAPSGGSQFSFLQLMFVYVTARLAHAMDIKIQWRHLILGGGGLYVVIMLILGGGMILMLSLFRKNYSGYTLYSWTSYDAPHVYLMALVLVMVFAQKVRVWPWLGACCRFCGASMFGVYLLHHSADVGPWLMVGVEDQLMALMALPSWLIVFLGAVIVFFVCLCVDLMRRGVLAGVSTIFKNIREMQTC